MTRVHAVASNTVVTPRLERYARARFPAAEIDDILRAPDQWRISYDEEDELPGERLQAAVLLVADGRGEDLAVGIGIDAAEG